MTLRIFHNEYASRINSIVECIFYIHFGILEEKSLREQHLRQNQEKYFDKRPTFFSLEIGILQRNLVLSFSLQYLLNIRLPSINEGISGRSDFSRGKKRIVDEQNTITSNIETNKPQTIRIQCTISWQVKLTIKYILSNVEGNLFSLSFTQIHLKETKDQVVNVSINQK